MTLREWIGYGLLAATALAVLVGFVVTAITDDRLWREFQETDDPQRKQEILDRLFP